MKQQPRRRLSWLERGTKVMLLGTIAAAVYLIWWEFVLSLMLPPGELAATTTADDPSSPRSVTISDTAETRRDEDDDDAMDEIVVNEQLVEDVTTRTQSQNLANDEQQQSTTTRTTTWRDFYYSKECQRLRRLPTGRIETNTFGISQRALCTDLEETLEARKEIPGSVDVSLAHRAIYIPVMKAGTQMFQEVFRRRFKGMRVEDKDLVSLALKRRNISDFFVFTFVRNPLSTFRSGYGEMSLYASKKKISSKARDSFIRINQTAANEPRRAIQCLKDVQRGLFNGLVPAHLYTQIWKTSRCYGATRKGLKIDFIGKLENAEADWRAVERRLGVPHEPLPVIHSSEGSKERLWAKKMIRFTKDAKSPYAELTRKVCDYYRGDFECFGYRTEFEQYCK